ncbi:MAG: hypothetical protein WD512_12765 [Candidatus Paceibacterota bacterium]
MGKIFSSIIPNPQNIFTLDESLLESIKHYVYKGCNWFINIKDPTKKTVIIFHGARNDEIPIPIFRGADFKINDNLISIGDMLYNQYDSPPRIFLGWYLNTKKYNNTPVYTEIITLIKKWCKNKILFCATSGGGFASIYFASLFRSNCLIGNPQIYLQKYPYYPNFIEILGKNNDCPDFKDLTEYIEENGFPNLIVYYINKKDLHHHDDHFIKFRNFCKNKNINLIDHIVDIDLNPHSNPWPVDKKMVNIIEETLELLDGK